MILSNPLFIGISFFIIINLMGILFNEFKLLHIFYPGELLVVIAPFIIWIETISYIIRPLSLSIRLFANILSGHVLLHIVSSYFTLFFKKKMVIIVSILVFFLILLVSLEFFVSIVQPLIFTLLLTFYMNEILMI